MSCAVSFGEGGRGVTFTAAGVGGGLGMPQATWIWQYIYPPSTSLSSTTNDYNLMVSSLVIFRDGIKLDSLLVNIKEFKLL